MVRGGPPVDRDPNVHVTILSGDLNADDDPNGASLFRDRCVGVLHGFQPVLGDAVRLDQGDARHLNRLYQLGVNAYLPDEAVGAGIYYGVRRGTRLIAAAGTHVISPQNSIAAVGNVYTDRE